MMHIDQTVLTATAATNRGEKLDPAQKMKLEKAVREFESIFVGYLLKSMRNTVQKADNSTDSFGGDMLEGMFDVELAKHISRNSHLGMADMLYRKMTGESPSKTKPATRAVDSAAPAGLSKKTPVSSQKTIESNSIAGGKNQASLDERLRNYDAYVTEASERFGVSDNLIKAVIATESAARSNVQSPKDAKGVMQLIDSTATEMGVKNVWDPRENILGGAKYLKHLLETFEGDETLAIASYNAGPGAVQKYGGVPPYRETKEYVARVMNFFKMFEEQENDNE